MPPRGCQPQRDHARESGREPYERNPGPAGWVCEMTRFPYMFLVVLVSSTVLSGCMDSSLYTLNLGTANPEDIHDTFEVNSGKVQVAVNAGGSGSATITLTDADGKEVYSQTVGTGGSNAARTASGAPGTWTIDIDFQNWSGGFNLAITGA